LTQPNQAVPFGSVPYGSLSTFATNQLDDWLLQLRDVVVARVTQMLNPLGAAQQFANEAGIPQLVDLLLGALGDLVLNPLEQVFSMIAAAITGLTAAGLDELTRWAEELQQWRDSIVFAVSNLFADFITGVLGSGHSVDDLITFFNSLGGLFPAVQDLLDGTAAAGVLSTITDFVDGTAQFIENGITSIILNDDGTAMSVSTLLNNFTGALGTFTGQISQTISQTMLDSPPQQPFPSAFPISFGELVATPVELFTQNAARVLSLDLTGDTLADTQFELIPLVTDIVNQAILETGRVAELIDGVVPNLQAPPVIQEFIDYTINSFNTNIVNDISNVFQTFTVNNVVTNVYDTLNQVAETIVYTQATNLIQDLYNYAQQVVSGIHIF